MAASDGDSTVPENGPWTMDQYAAMCRERCAAPAQGYDEGDDQKPCGWERTNDDGETVYSFCGRHWGPVLDSMEGHDA